MGMVSRPRAANSEPSPRFLAYEIPWATVAKDSASVLFTAFLTAPDSIAGLPISLWLDSSFQSSQGNAVWRKRRPSPDEALFLKAFKALLAMDWLDAGQKHQQGLAATRGKALSDAFKANSALLLLAVGEKAEGEARLSQVAARRGSAGDPARRSLVNLWLALGKWDRADSLLDGMLEQEPSHAFAARAKTFLLRQEGTSADYEDFLKRQARARHASPGLRKAYGALLLEKGRYHEAAQMFQKALESDPNDGDAWVALGRAFMRQELWIFAEESFRHGLTVGTRDLDVFKLYAQVLLRCCVHEERPGRDGVLNQAQKLLERGVAAQLNHRSSAILLFDLYELSGNAKAAEAIRRNLWFHFEDPWIAIPPLGFASWKSEQPERYLSTAWNDVTFPLFAQLQRKGYLARDL